MSDGPSKFNLESYLNHSRKVEVEDLDFAAVKDHPISSDEVRCLTYMMDVEEHTMKYLQGLLRTCAIRDPETVAFLSCWVYEEFFHGRVLRRFLKAAEVSFVPDRYNRRWRERLEEAGSFIFCHTFQDFHAVYYVWGAVQELSTLEAYGILAKRTQHPILRELLLRIVQDERRHFSFYVNKAKGHLQRRPAQQLAALLLRRFWTPVGDGVKSDADVQWMSRFVFGGAEGKAATARIDATIARLPGLEWFDLMSRHRNRLPPPLADAAV